MERERERERQNGTSYVVGDDEVDDDDDGNRPRNFAN